MSFLNGSAHMSASRLVSEEDGNVAFSEGFHVFIEHETDARFLLLFVSSRVLHVTCTLAIYFLLFRCMKSYWS